MRHRSKLKCRLSRVERLETRIAFAVGDLDVTFGNGGVTREGILQAADSADSALEIISRPDGGFYVAGNIGNGRGFSGIVWSYHSDGRPDASFGTNGHAAVPLASGWERLVDMAMQPDGKLVLTGYARDSRLQSTSVSILSRLNANGTLDASFGDNGQQRALMSFHSGPSAIVVRPSGHILVLGGEFNNVHLVQYLPDGSVDTEFGNSGVTSYPISENSPSDLLLLADGSALASMSLKVNDNSYAARVLKYLPNGQLDASFGDNGILDFPVASQVHNNVYGLPLKLAAAADGSVLLVGTSRVDEVHDFFVAKFSANGLVDDAFGNGGRTNIAVGGTFGTVLHDLEVRSDDSIVLTATELHSGISGRAVVNIYLNGNGLIDVAAPGQGRVAFEHSTNDFGATTMAGNRLIFAGTINTQFFSSDVQLVGIAPSGALDPAFGINGRVTTNTEDTRLATTFQDVLQLPDSKLLVATENFLVSATSNQQLLFQRYTSAGTPDLGYAESGKHVVGEFLKIVGGIRPHFQQTSTANYFVVQNQTELRVAKLTDEGDIDPSGFTNGWWAWQSAATLSRVDDLLITEQAIYIAGTSRYTFENGSLVYNNVIAKLDFSGQLVASFGNSGLVELPVRQHLAGSGMALQMQGADHILVLRDNHPDDLLFAVSLARLDTDGKLDETFGDEGRSQTNLNTGAALDRRRDIRVLPDGGFLILGTLSFGGLGAEVRVQRFDRDGHLVSTFGNSGYARVPVATSGQEPYNFAVDGEGRIVVSSAVVDELSTATVVTRFLPDGNLDASFGDGGSKRFAFGEFSESFPSLTIVENDDIILAGSETQTAATLGILARIAGSGPDQTAWHNQWLAEDVNGDRIVSPIDALIIINRLNTGADGQLPTENIDAAFVDVNNDGFATPIDALLIINRLNQMVLGEAEASQPASTVNSADSSVFADQAAWMPDLDQWRQLKSHWPWPLEE